LIFFGNFIQSVAIFASYVSNGDQPHTVNDQHYNSSSNISCTILDTSIGTCELIESKEKHIESGIVENLMQEAVPHSVEIDLSAVFSQASDFVEFMSKKPDKEVCTAEYH